MLFKWLFFSLFSIGYQVLHTQLLPGEAEDLPGVGKYLNHVHVLTKRKYLVDSIYMIGVATDYYINHLLLVWNSLY